MIKAAKLVVVSNNNLSALIFLVLFVFITLLFYRCVQINFAKPLKIHLPTYIIYRGVGTGETDEAPEIRGCLKSNRQEKKYVGYSFFSASLEIILFLRPWKWSSPKCAFLRVFGHYWPLVHSNTLIRVGRSYKINGRIYLTCFIIHFWSDILLETKLILLSFWIHLKLTSIDLWKAYLGNCAFDKCLHP